MYRYRNLLIPLELTEMDKTIIQYTTMVNQLSKSNRIYCLYVNRNVNISKEILKEYPQLLKPVNEYAMQKMQQMAKDKLLGHPETKLVFKVEEGSSLEILLDQITNEDIDLVLVRKKRADRVMSQLPIKLARKAPCSVLVIPDGAEPSITKILVPVDFSEYSADAIDIAVSFASANGISNIHCLHVFQLPLGFYKAGKSQEEFTEIMKNNAVKSYKYFIRNIDLKDVEVTSQFIQNEEPATAIRSVIEKEQIDLTVIGARGRNAGAGVLLGSVTENLILSTQVPIIAVKKKGSGLGFLNALFKYV